MEQGTARPYPQLLLLWLHRHADPRGLASSQAGAQTGGGRRHVSKRGGDHVDPSGSPRQCVPGGSSQDPHGAMSGTDLPSLSGVLYM